MTVSPTWLNARASQTSSQTQRPEATKNVGWFQRQSWGEIIHSRLGYLLWIIAEPKCWKRVCLACRHLKGNASQEENSLCYVSSSEHLYFIWRPDDEKVQGAKSQSRLDSPNDYTSLSTGLRTLQAEIKASLLPALRGTTSTPLPFLLSKCNICEERKELVHLRR